MALALGTYYYKISALLPASDANNPAARRWPPISGLRPSVLAAKRRSLGPCIPTAVKYRIFRTISANQPAGTERLLTERTAVASCSGSPLPNETFTDDESATPAGLRPQPPGALGDDDRPADRARAAGSEDRRRPHLRGRRMHHHHGLGGLQRTETNTIDVAALSAGSIANWTAAAATLTQARRQAGITLVNKSTAPGEFTSAASNLNDAWLMVSYGQFNGGALSGPSATDVGKVISGGSAVASPTFAAASYGPNGFGVQGGWAEAIADLLLVYGNTGTTGFACRRARPRSAAEVRAPRPRASAPRCPRLR